MKEELLINLFVIFIISVFYLLGLYSLLSFMLWPNESLGVIDYVIEIIGYIIIGTILLVFRKKIVKSMI